MTAIDYASIENETAAAPRAGRREWLGLAVIALPCMLYAMDLTVLHLAVPALSRDLAPSATELLWIIDVYGFFVAGALITMGTLGDRFGRRRLLLFGAAAFGVASVLAAFSTSTEMLIATRALLGLAGATIAPSTMSLIRNLFPDPRQFTTAIGVWISSFSVGSAIGPLVGGLLLEYFWWGSVFLLAVPVMVLLLIVGPRLLPEYRDPAAGRPDLPSAALSLAAVLAVIYGLKQVAQHGPDWPAALSVAAGLALGALFVQRQRTLADPLIDLRLFAIRSFSAALLVYALAIFAAFGAFLFVPQYLQLVRGLSPLPAGLWTLGFSLSFVVGSMVTPHLAQRASSALLIAAGLVVAALGNLLLVGLDGHSNLWQLVAGSTILGLGLSPAFTLANDLIIGTAPPERAGAASGISETAAELAVALGIAGFGSLGAAVYRAHLAATLPPGLPPEAAATARETLAGAAEAAAHLPEPLARALLETAQAGFVQGLQLTALISAIVSLALAALTLAVLRGLRTGAQSEAADGPHGAP